MKSAIKKRTSSHSSQIPASGSQPFIQKKDVGGFIGPASSSNQGSGAGRHLLSNELAHTIRQDAVRLQLSPENTTANTLPSADELTTRIAKCIGIWETNRSKDEPSPRESDLKTTAGISASMATIEQATMAYSITTLKKFKTLRDKAKPALTMKELNSAEARCIAVSKLLDSVASASAESKSSDDFIKENAASILASGLSNDDVKTMFGEVTLKATIDASRTDIETKKQAISTLVNSLANASKKGIKPDDFVKDNATEILAAGLSEEYVKEMFSTVSKKTKADSESAAKSEMIDNVTESISEDDRLGLDESSLRSYIRKKKNWGENESAWQRKAVNAMSDNIGTRIEEVAEADGGTSFFIPVIKERVNTELAKDPIPGEEEIVKVVAQQNNPNETNYGENVWKTYNRLYPKVEPAAEQLSKKLIQKKEITLQRTGEDKTVTEEEYGAGEKMLEDKKYHKGYANIPFTGAKTGKKYQAGDKIDPLDAKAKYGSESGTTWCNQFAMDFVRKVTKDDPFSAYSKTGATASTLGTFMENNKDKFGAISSFEDAWKEINAGSLVLFYTPDHIAIGYPTGDDEMLTRTVDGKEYKFGKLIQAGATVGITTLNYAWGKSSFSKIKVYKYKGK